MAEVGSDRTLVVSVHGGHSDFIALLFSGCLVSAGTSTCIRMSLRSRAKPLASLLALFPNAICLAQVHVPYTFIRRPVTNEKAQGIGDAGALHR